MIKQAPRPAAMAAMLAFAASCVAVLLYLWLSFGGAVPLDATSYRVHVYLPEGTQLNAQADVRISGVPVGKVVKLKPGPRGSNLTDATLELKAKYAPIPIDSRALLRTKTLLGETYVTLSPGDRDGPKLADGKYLPRGAAHSTVELDEIFRSFDPSTRKAFQTWMQAQAGAVEGRGADINASFAVLPEFADSGTRILRQLNGQGRAVSGLIRDTGQVFDALSERRGQLSSLITNSNRLFEATNRRNQDLAGIFRELPRFERESRATLPRLTAFARRAKPVTDQLQPVASEFQPTFDDVRKLSPQLRGFFDRLGPLVTASKRGVPAFETLTRQLPPLFADFQPFLRNVNPIVGYLSANKREITSLLGNLTSATNTVDQQITLPGAVDPVHYLKAETILGPQGLGYLPRPLGSTRANAYTAPGGLSRLGSGLATLDPGTCTNGDPDQPTSSVPPELTPLVKLYAYRTEGRAVARPACSGQGNYPGFSTAFPRLTAEP